MVSIINCLTSIYAGFAVFISLGFMAKAAGVPIENVVESGMLVKLTLHTSSSERKY